MLRLLMTTMLVLAPAAVLRAAQTFYPVKDGTLADGGVYGPYDGVADNADWYFNQSSYEGSIARSSSAPGVGLENRVVWEYDLSTVTLTPPVGATLQFNLRGAPIFQDPPFPDADVHVYAYPADLAETLADFNAAPEVLQGVATVAPFQPSTAFSIDVSAAVNDALLSGADKVAFRFQIDPLAPEPANQAYVDALESNQTTKPALVVDEAPNIPGDIDGDGDVDTDDFLGFPPCFSGPGIPPTSGCEVYDFDVDEDVDLTDYATFQSYVTP